MHGRGRDRVQGEGVTLQPCGVSSKTVWILDTLDQSFTPASAHGTSADQRLGHQLLPAVRAELPGQGFPTDKPRPQLAVPNLTGFSFNGQRPQFGTIASGEPALGRPLRRTHNREPEFTP